MVLAKWQVAIYVLMHTSYNDSMHSGITSFRLATRAKVKGDGVGGGECEGGLVLLFSCSLFDFLVHIFI